MASKKIVNIYISHAGCIHQCIFCDQDKISGTSRDNCLDFDHIITKIDEQLVTLAKHSNVEIAFYGGSFTALPPKIWQELLEIANKYVKHYKLLGIRFSTRPDCIDEDTIAVLNSYPITVIELGVQSLDEDILAIAKRGHSVADVQHAVKLLEKNNYKYVIQLMCGLPNDNREKFIKTVKNTIRLKPIAVRIYPVLVLAGTELAELYLSDKFTPWTLENTVSILAEAIQLLNLANINIIRLGLQSSNTINSHKTVLAGANHPAIRQLVEGRIFLEIIINYITNDKINSNFANIIKKIVVHPKDETAFRGNKNQNILFIKNIINNNDLIIDVDSNVKVGCVLINDTEEIRCF